MKVNDTVQEINAAGKYGYSGAQIAAALTVTELREIDQDVQIELEDLEIMLNSLKELGAKFNMHQALLVSIELAKMPGDAFK